LCVYVAGKLHAQAPEGTILNNNILGVYITGGLHAQATGGIIPNLIF
jgi:hypothetical protein